MQNFIYKGQKLNFCDDVICSNTGFATDHFSTKRVFNYNKIT